ncbi:MAG: iron-containing alcohol dehydrogenase [Lachnospiraceae bacterium]|nr:iron-containing alcohol dehydrogenase [Lachnospiraceae bacterium]
MKHEYYEFQHRTKIMSGDLALEKIPAELIGIGVKRPMLLSDQGLAKAGTLAVVMCALSEGEMKPACVDTDIPRDSSLSCVNRMAAEYKECDCDCIIAVGGGSVLDTAKGVRMVLSQGTKDVIHLAGCESLKRGKEIPFVAVPTTAGTGSESTLVAVIRNDETKIKMEYISYYLQPDFAVLDPRMTQTLPPRLTASTGMDALCHAIEAYTCIQKNPVSDAYAFGAIELIRDHLFTAVKIGKRTEARLAMANASMMAGAAFSNSMVGIVHAIGHALGGVCHVPHGDAMNILLPYGMKYNYKICREDYAKLLLALAGAEVYAQTPQKDRAKESIRTVLEMRKKLYRICGLPTHLREVGVKPEDFEKVAEVAVNDGAMIVNPRAAGIEDVLNILAEAY